MSSVPILLLLNICLGGAFDTDNCVHGEVENAVKKSVNCKKQVIETELAKNKLTSYCILVMPSNQLKKCVEKEFKQCLSKSRLEQFTYKTKDIRLNGLKVNCKGTEKVETKNE